MFAKSKAMPKMIDLIKNLKNKCALKIAFVNNEARELNAYRIEKFKLANFVDFFISFSFVHFRKPYIDIFKVALNIAQVKSNEVIYIEDQPMFVSVAESLSIRGIHHINYGTTCKKLQSVELTVN